MTGNGFLWQFSLCVLLAGLEIGCGGSARPVQEVQTAPDEITDAIPIEVTDHDWPWWRGLRLNNTAACTSAVTTWSEKEHVIWKTHVPGRGHGTPIILGDRIYLCTADEPAQLQLVVCFDRLTGNRIWQTTVHTGRFPDRHQMHGKSTHANCTLATDGHFLFAGFLNGDHIHASSLTLDGEIRWQTDLGYFDSKFGYAPSPCLYQSLVIYAGDNRGGGFLAAVHRESGKVVWRKARGNVSSYSSPVVGHVGGRDQLLISGNAHVTSYNPLTGEQLWACPGTAEATSGTVVCWEDMVFASGGYPQRNTVCVDARSGTERWHADFKCYEQSMLVVDGYLYAVTDDGIAVCHDARTGEMQWRHRLSGPVSASPLLVGNTIYASNESGRTWVFEASPKEYRQIAVNRLGSSMFASLTAVDERLYARVGEDSGRHHKEWLYCLGQPVNSEKPGSDTETQVP